MKLNLRPERRILRQFAWAMLIVLPLIAGFLHWKHGLSATWAWSIAGIGVFVGIVELTLVAALGAAGSALEAVVVRPIFVGLSVIAYPIGFVLSHVLMAAIFYFVVTPIGLVFRLLGRDVMGKKLDPAAQSYWRDRGPQRPASSYFKLY
jgi:multisubunit Na+/H+ antiporter MnhG subunit